MASKTNCMFARSYETVVLSFFRNEERLHVVHYKYFSVFILFSKAFRSCRIDKRRRLGNG